MNPSPTLDVRTIPPPVRHPEIFRTFDALESGAGFVLVNDHYPKPLLYQFMHERPGLFEWNVLQSGPDLYRVQIQKREHAGARTISDYLETDHRRLDELLAQVNEALESEDIELARTRFGELECGLERHMQAEEQVLFPLFEQATGMVGGPVVVMNREHSQLRELFVGVSGALDREDFGAAADGLATAAQLLEQHNLKEENIIYPHSDRALANDGDRDAVVRDMQAL